MSNRNQSSFTHSDLTLDARTRTWLPRRQSGQARIQHLFPEGCSTTVTTAITIAAAIIIPVVIAIAIGGVLEAPVPEKSGLVKKMSPFSKP